jgi:hypothetical protein
VDHITAFIIRLYRNTYNNARRTLLAIIVKTLKGAYNIDLFNLVTFSIFLNDLLNKPFTIFSMKSLLYASVKLCGLYNNPHYEFFFDPDIGFLKIIDLNNVLMLLNLLIN